jgi:hypothetical protein
MLVIDRIPKAVLSPDEMIDRLLRMVSRRPAQAWCTAAKRDRGAR